MIRYFCTYFDLQYLPRGLALYQSLRSHCPSFQLWVLCMDRTCYDVLARLALPGLSVISLEEYEKDDPDLLRAKTTRTLIEYYFTCSPSLPLFILNRHPQVDVITYLDADLGFFADPQPLFEEMGDRSIAIIGHRCAPYLEGWERFGIYNVGWLSFRRDQHALECLHWWRERCLEWCYDRCENGRFADQKYLDDWPTRFHGVAVLQHKGANLAPWNLANYVIRRERDRVWVDDQPLIFFHFHRLKQIEGWVYDPTMANYNAKASSVVRRSIYAPYIRTLVEAARQMPPALQDTALRSSVRDPAVTPGFSGRMVRRVKRMLHLFRGIVIQNYLFVPNGRVF
jgi:hypothetical protein